MVNEKKAHPNNQGSDHSGNHNGDRAATHAADRGVVLLTPKANGMRVYIFQHGFAVIHFWLLKRKNNVTPLRLTQLPRFLPTKTTCHYLMTVSLQTL
jgi:hypothetical protein